MFSEIQLPSPTKTSSFPSLAGATAATGVPMATSSSSPLLVPVHAKKLTLVPLIFLIYFEVSGGPYGAEPAVGAAGPLLALLGFLIFPFVWSIPEALITAELATAIPGNGGYVLWAERAFGPLAGSLMGSWKFLSGAINSAAYPVLCANYLARAIHALADGAPRDVTVVLFTLLLSFLNYTGLTIVGYTAVALGVVSLAPFLIMAGFAIPKLQPRRWLVVAKDKDWRLFLNTLFWNLNFWDNASTLAGEVEKPQRTFPKALLASGLMTCIGYFLPLLAGTGALDSEVQWGDGFFADAAGIIAGKWLKFWIETGAVLSAIGLYEAQLSSSSFQLLGMADLGMLPAFFASRAKWFHTPWVGILVSSSISLAISFMSFTKIISSANFLYGLGMLLEFASFLWLRKKHPSLKRPYQVPMPFSALVFMCLVPSGFLISVMVIATWEVFIISGGLTLFGIGVYYLMGHCRSHGYMEFKKGKEKIEEENEEEAANRVES